MSDVQRYMTLSLIPLDHGYDLAPEWKVVILSTDHEQERARLIQALRSCVIGATEAQSDSDGFVSLYVMQTGPIHRAIALLQEFGYHDRPGFDSLTDSGKEA